MIKVISSFEVYDNKSTLFAICMPHKSVHSVQNVLHKLHSRKFRGGGVFVLTAHLTSCVEWKITGHSLKHTVLKGHSGSPVPWWRHYIILTIRPPFTPKLSTYTWAWSQKSSIKHQFKCAKGIPFSQTWKDAKGWPYLSDRWRNYTVLTEPHVTSIPCTLNFYEVGNSCSDPDLCVCALQMICSVRDCDLHQGTEDYACLVMLM